VTRTSLIRDSIHGACDRADWHRLVARVSARLVELGVGEGARVVFTLPSDLRAAVLFAALWHLRAVAVPLNRGAPLALVEQVIASTGATAWIQEIDWQSGCALRAVPGAPANGVRLTNVPPDLAVIIQTSGTTGRPKGVMLSHRALAYQAQVTSEVLGYGPSDHLYLPIPLWHSYGLSVLLSAQASGASLFLGGSVAPNRLVDQVLAEGCTSLDAVPALYHWLLAYLEREPKWAGPLQKQVRLWGIGGDRAPIALAHRFDALIGRPLLDGYGLTEAGPNVAIATPESWRPGWSGRPLPGTAVRLERVEPDEPCELLVQSPSLMSGYWAEPTETQAVLRDGWLRTGDLAELDEDGRLRIIGRRGRRIITAGANVSPAEVEDVLLRLPWVSEAVVIGLPDQDRGEIVAAFIVPNGERPVAARLRQELGRQLERYKIPRRIRYLTRLPRNANGKVDRALLRDLAMGTVGALEEAL
jgi:long-chain acyl-CoA synthetase